ncbi:MAG: beta-lactamase family protein [Acidimicrobiales bacterium]|nr:beta-lactamase family protein [Acidimicrobiales bacterium]
MPIPLVEQAVGGVLDTAFRRCSVPADLDSITTIGEEDGPSDVADELWSRVEVLYRTGMHPGLQVCIRHQDDVVLERAIGHARGNLPGRRFDPDRAVPMTVDTPINLFSAAKAVTGMVVHKLEETGAFTLDDRVADHVPGFDRHGKGDITLRDVLTHRAGVPTLPAHAFDLDLLLDHERIEAELCNLRPVSAPGEKPAYHAVTGGFIMEAVARRAAGRSLRDVLAEEIKEPLGLQWFDFGVDPSDAHLVAHNVMTGLPLGFSVGWFMRRILGKDWAPVLKLSNDDRFLSGVIPSGNAIVTARDVALFYQCLMNGGRIGKTRVFKKKTVKRALRPSDTDLEFDRMLGMPMRYSPGFMLGSETFSLYGWNHPDAFGHVGMSNLWTWADPGRDLVVAFLTTGKPVLGTHLVALPQVIAGIHEAFPPK